MGAVVKICPAEAHVRVGRIERNHATLRSIYEELKLDLPGIRGEERRSLTFRAVNDAPNSNSGISPTTLAFRVYPKIPGAGPRGTMAEQADIIRECAKMAIRQNARPTIRESTRVRNSPSVSEVEQVRLVPPGGDVRVYRGNNGRKIYPLVRVHHNDVDVTLPSGKISTFPINMVRPYWTATQQDCQLTERKSPSEQVTKVPFLIVTRSKSAARRNTEVSKGYKSHSTLSEMYRSSRLEEINGLQEQGCFEVFYKQESDSHRMCRPVFVDKAKPDGSKRSRLCAAVYNDQDHGLFTAAPTLKRTSLRLLIGTAASLKLDTFTRDVTKAFVMSKTKLLRTVYMKAQSEMKLDKMSVLKAMRPLYGMPESLMHWFKTYLDYHRMALDMLLLPMDPCILYSMKGNTRTGLQSLQAADTLCAGRPEFLEKGIKKSCEFPNKGRKAALHDKVKFNGIHVKKRPNGYALEQTEYIGGIPKFSLK